MMTRGRVKKAAEQLAAEPTARNYVGLAREYAGLGLHEEVQRVCKEGLTLHAEDSELHRLADRAHQFLIEDKIQMLQAELESSPRAVPYRQLCQLLIEADLLDRAEIVAEDWFERASAPEALLWQARVLAQRFYADRRAADGAAAFDLAFRASEALPDDIRPLLLQEEIAGRVGAWIEARRCLARLLELVPGAPDLEARFRRVLSLSEGCKPLDRALADVERSGRFVSEEPEQARANQEVSVRPMLQELSSEKDVRAAIYLRGGTALVQGPRGATAERTARSVRELVVEARSCTRRMRLGQPTGVLLEGDFGSLLLSPGDRGTSALWCEGAVKHRHEELLRDLSGMAVSGSGESE
jgi:hypothetical protein